MSYTKFLSGKRVLVTGASGFIGRRLCEKLKQQQTEVFAVSRKKRKQTKAVDKWFKGDLVDFEFTKSVIKESNSELIFHLAAFVSGCRDSKAVFPTFHNNVTATVNMLMASLESDVRRFILAGTMEEPNHDKPVPVSPYAASKWANTVYARMFHKLYDTPIAIARIFMVYGPGDQNDRLVPYVIQSLLRDEKPRLTSGRRLVDWIFIDDVVEGLIQMGQAKDIEGKAIELGSGKQYSIRQICKKIEHLMDSEVQIEFGELPDRPFEKERVANLTRAKIMLDWEPKVGINEGLKKTIAWFPRE